MRFDAEGITVRYRGVTRPALEEITVAVPAGRLTAVLGPNGSGKSTLLRALMGAIPLESGRASIDGRDVAAWDRRMLACTVGVVPQTESTSFPLTVREMVGLGRYPHLGPVRSEGPVDHEAVRRALERCAIAELAERRITTLSGGELQRTRIARALAQEPRALVLDEPTASLDLRHEMAILGSLREWADGGTTVLLITHDLDLAARFADRMVLLDGGRLAAEGAPEEVLREDVLERVFGWPVRVDRDPIVGALRVIPLR